MSNNHPKTVERIVIEGYKSIKKLDLELRPINILIGANGSGKSNFLSFFELLKNSYEQKLQEYISLNGVDNFLHKGDKITSEIYCKLILSDVNAYSLKLKMGVDHFIVTEEGLWYKYNPNVPNPVNISSNALETTIKFNQIPRAEYINKYLSKISKYHFHDTGKNSPFNKYSNVENDITFIYNNGENIAAYLWNIKKNYPKDYLRILRTVQSIAPYISDFHLVPDSRNELKLRWMSKFDDKIYGPTSFSDGTIRFIALTTLFLQPRLPHTIIIDEPELGLHPFAIAKLSGLIQSAKARGCQVIVATQSTDLISHFQPEDIVAVDLINGESKFERLNSERLENWLDAYTIDDLWKRNIINLGQPNY